MLYIGEGYNKMFLVNKGKISGPIPPGRATNTTTCGMLSNGNILFTRMQYVAEVTPKRKLSGVMTPRQGPKSTLASRSGWTRSCSCKNGLPPKLMVVNIKTKAVEVQHELPARVRPTPGPSMRSSPDALHAKGTYLVHSSKWARLSNTTRIQGDLEVRDQEPLGRHPPAERQHLITDEQDILNAGSQPQERDRLGSQAGRPAGGPTGISTRRVHRLANGNTIICSRGDNGKGPQLVEVTPAKKVVWVLRDWPIWVRDRRADSGRSRNPGKAGQSQTERDYEYITFSTSPRRTIGPAPWPCGLPFSVGRVR